MSTKKTCKDMNRKRFSDDQIKSLETTFQTEARPALRMKQQLADTLGLHPRQVAIWFQNKRARSKSKQIEQEYALLKADYDALASQFENLRKENQTLLLQLQRLRKMAGTSYGEEEDNRNQMILATSEKPTLLLEVNSRDLCMPSSMIREIDYLEEEANLLNMAQIAEGSLTSPENGCSFDSGTFLDANNATSSKWWDF